MASRGNPTLNREITAQPASVPGSRCISPNASQAPNWPQDLNRSRLTSQDRVTEGRQVHSSLGQYALSPSHGLSAQVEQLKRDIDSRNYGTNESLIGSSIRIDDIGLF